MSLPPDEDEDTTRLCVHCGDRPRWSRHWSCKRCASCAGKSISWCIKRRKWDSSESRQPKRIWSTYEAVKLARRARYRTLRLAGADYEMARTGKASDGAFKRAAEQLGRPDLVWKSSTGENR